MKCLECGQQACAKKLCKKCYNKTWKKDNPEKYKATRRREYAKHREALLAYKKSVYNPKRKKEYNTRYYQANKEHLQGQITKYYYEVYSKRPGHKAKQAAKRSLYRAGVSKRAVLSTTSDLQFIKDIYAQCPVGYEVDHIEPLYGKEVSGLHVWWNLCYRKRSENRAKGNKRLAD